MALYVQKSKADMISQVLKKIVASTPISSVGPGSVARAYAEAITAQVGDFYTALDFNIAQSVVSTATGAALDKIGLLFGVERNTVSTLTEIARTTGSFYFYIDTPFTQSITIPSGTRVFTSSNDFIGRQYSFVTTTQATIAIGETRTFTTIRPEFTDSVFTAGVDTLVVHSFVSPSGTTVKCRNPKVIAPQQGYEDDAAYRARIIKQVRVAGSGTLEALRFAALGVTGVRDVKIRQTPYGLGSFEVIVTPEVPDATRAILVSVNDIIEPKKPLGTRMYLREPITLATDVSVSIVISRVNTAVDQLLLRQVEAAIVQFLNSFLPGDVLVYNRLIQVILDVSNRIRDVQVTRYAPNGVEALRKNYKPEEDQQIIPGSVQVSIA